MPCRVYFIFCSGSSRWRENLRRCHFSSTHSWIWAGRWTGRARELRLTWRTWRRDWGAVTTGVDIQINNTQIVMLVYILCWFNSLLPHDSILEMHSTEFYLIDSSVMFYYVSPSQCFDLWIGSTLGVFFNTNCLHRLEQHFVYCR